MAGLAATMSTCRLVPTTYLKTSTMIPVDTIFSSHGAFPAWALAGMATGEDLTTSQPAFVFWLRDVDMALNGYHMSASWHLLLNRY